MKKLLLLVFVALSFASVAQTEKGKQVIGGDLGGRIGIGGGSSAGRLMISPSYGYFLANNWVVEGQLRTGLSYFGSTNNSGYYRNWNLGLGVNSRYYFLFGKNVRPFAEVGITAMNYYARSETINGYDRALTPHLGLGLECWIGDRISVFGKVQVAPLNLSSSPTYYGVNVPFGLHYYFGRPKSKK